MRLFGETGPAVRSAGCGNAWQQPLAFAWGAAPRASWLALFALVSLTLGCTRSFFRDRADVEVSEILAEKNRDQDWKLSEYFVYPHPSSRFADPSNPDQPPMPPDDPAAWSLAPRPQWPKRVALVEGQGYLELLAAWDAENRERLRAKQGGPEGELPPPRALPPKDGPSSLPDLPPGPPSENPPSPMRREPFLVTLEQVCELASLNSREFQDKREDLYLAALPVTLQRFAFASQFEALTTKIREWAGSESSVGGQNRWISNSTLGWNKLFVTGALLAVQLTNQTVIRLGESQPHTLSSSILDLDLVQPLLRGGGRAVTLEPLTQAERDLLYEIRNFARFHKVFFVAIAGGLGMDIAVGYLPTLRVLSHLRNEEENERAFAKTLRYFKALAGGGSISKLQVDQVELAHLSARSTVLQRKQEYGETLDRFKLQLGLPIDTPLELDNGPLAPLASHMRQFETVQDFYTDALKDAHALRKAVKVREAVRAYFAAQDLLRGTKLQEDVLARLGPWQNLKAIDGRLAGLAKERERLQNQLALLEAEQKPVAADLREKLRAVAVDYNVGALELALRLYEAQPQRIEAFQRVVDRIGILLAQARSERVALLRQQWPQLPPLYLQGTNLLQLVKQDEPAAQSSVALTALANRLDLMNQRAQLVDAWRKIAVFANSLLGTFDVGYNLQAITPPDGAKPLAFSSARTRQQLRLHAELPLVRKLERNNYRTSLIVYQRQRRELMLAEDRIVQNVRQQLRHLQQLAEAFEIEKRSLELAYLQVTLALEEFRAPPAPGEQSNAAAAAAALTRQLLDAQRSVPEAQNTLFDLWIDYVTSRMTLYRDLELMRVDARGVWIDELASPESVILPTLEFTGSVPAGPGVAPAAPGVGRAQRAPADPR